MKTTYNDKGEEITETLWESDDTPARTGADPGGTSEPGPSAAQSSAAPKERQAGSGAGNAKKSSAAGAKGSAKVSMPPSLLILRYVVIHGK